MKRKGWWQQLQSGEFPKTKLKYGDSNWVNFRPPIPKSSPNTSPPINTQLCGLTNANNQIKPSLPDDRNEPQITIDKIQNILKEVYDAKDLHELLSSHLNNLREIYKTNKSLFSNKDMVFLKDTNNTNNSLILLIKLSEELVQLPSIENPHNLFIELLSLLERFKGTAIHRRVEREIRKFRKQYPDYRGY